MTLFQNGVRIILDDDGDEIEQCHPWADIEERQAVEEDQERRWALEYEFNILYN